MPKTAAIPASKAPLWMQPRALLGAVGVLAAGLIALAVLVVTGVVGGTTQVLSYKTCPPGTPGCDLRQPIHEHANFALIIRGKVFDFNKPEFLSTEGNDRSALAHLHEPRVGVVHVHISGTTWHEFFKSLGFDLTDPSFDTVTNEQTCLKLPSGEKLCGTATEKFHFVVNGVKVDGVDQTQIHDLDRVLISYGPETDAQAMALFAQVPDDACIPSLRCAERIPPGEPKEQCVGKVPGCIKAGS